MWTGTENQIEKQAEKQADQQIELVLIRHGATKSNLEHRYLGKTDESLCDEGIERLRLYKDAGYYPELDLIFTSPMKRCVETAEILYPSIESIKIPGFEETNFGEFEGKNYQELNGNPKYQEWIDSMGKIPFPGGESREEFIDRCRSGFETLTKKLLDESVANTKQIRVGLIVHGGTIMALLHSYAGGEYFDYQVSLGDGYICSLKVEDEKIQLQKKILCL